MGVSLKQPDFLNKTPVSERGVVFFRNQNINLEQQKVLVQKLGELSGKPESSKLHVHPLFNSPDNSPVNAAGDQDPYGELNPIILYFTPLEPVVSVHGFVKESSETVQDYAAQNDGCTCIRWLAL